MQISQLVSAARSAGLEQPRVIPLRRRAGTIVYQLMYGPQGARESLELPFNVTSQQLKEALDAVSVPAA